MADSYLAVITPLSSGAPSHPIAPGGPPPGIWGGAPSHPDQGLPPPGVGVWPPPGSPAHPIAPGGPPPGVWPPPVHPDHSLPPPVSIWPPPVGPDNTLPPLPPGIWGGEAPPHVDNTLPPPVIAGTPEHPIALPPGTIWPPLPGVQGDLVILVYVPFVGYRWLVIDADLSPSHPIAPTPEPK